MGWQASQAPQGSHTTRCQKPGMTFLMFKGAGSRQLSCLLKPGLRGSDESSLTLPPASAVSFSPSPTPTHAL